MLVLKPYSYGRTCINVFWIFVKHGVTVPCSICAQTLLRTEEMSGKRDAYCANKTHLLCDTKMGLKTFWQKKISRIFVSRVFRSCSVYKILRLCLLSGPFLPRYNCWKLLPNCISSFFAFCSVLRSAIVWTKMSVVIKDLFLPSRVI